MFKWAGRRISNKLTALITDSGDGLALTEVLQHSDLSASAKAEVPELVDFLMPQMDEPPNAKQRERLAELAGWALTPPFLKERFDFRLSRNAANLLSQFPGQILKRTLYTDSPLPHALRDFLGSPFAHQEVYCGHFQRITEALLRATRGEIFQQLVKDFLMSLIPRTRSLALRTLLLRIITDCAVAFEGEAPLAGMTLPDLLRSLTAHGAKLACHGKGKPVPHRQKEPAPLPENVRMDELKYTHVVEPLRKRYVRHPGERPLGKSGKRNKMIPEYEESVFAVLSILKELEDENPPAFESLRTPDILRHLLKIGRDAHTKSVVLPLVYRLIGTLRKLPPTGPEDTDAVFEEFQPLGPLDKHRVFHMFPMWPKQLLQMAKPWFFNRDPESDSLNTAFVRTVMELKDTELEAFLLEENGKVLLDVMDGIPRPGERLLNGQLLKLALFIADPDRNKVVTPLMMDPRWREFVIEKLLFWRGIEFAARQLDETEEES
jgi:hypothetical protein